MLVAKAAAASTISPAPTSSVRRRPKRSARVVSSREMPVSPRSVRLSSSPIRGCGNPAAVRCSTSTTEVSP